MATSALGAGFHLSRLRLVLCVDPPLSLIEVVQRLGRAGRDGAEADFLLLWDPRSLGTLVAMASGSAEAQERLLQQLFLVAK